jgi:putative nucleotidyltransferase with HDIG domain
MRQHKATAVENTFSILALDDDPIMTSTIQDYFQRSGYRVDVENNPLRAIERVRDNHYDILLLDFLMTPLCGDQVVEEIRKFNHDLFIILLTGHKTMAPPIRTIRALDIQGYYEKSDRFDQLELLVESCAKSIRQMRTIQLYQSALTSMMASLPGIYQLQSLDHIADSVLVSMSNLLDSVGCVLALDRTAHIPDAPASQAGNYLSRAAGTMVPGPDSHQMEQIVEKLRLEGHFVLDKQVFFPLSTPDHSIGFLGLEFKQSPQFHQIQLLEIFSRQVSVALSNASLHELVQEKNTALDQANGRLRTNYAETITAVRRIVDAKDFYTRNHSDRVAFYAVELARHMGRSDAYCETLKVAGLFHDIGKLSIPDGILLKEDRLTDVEFEVIKTHSARGAELLSDISSFQDILPVVRSHHERYDGTGYPDGLAGEMIPEQARIITVADSFDAMTSDRRYRASLGVSHAIEELLAGRGTQFDPAMVDIFVPLARDPDLMVRADAANGSVV